MTVHSIVRWLALAASLSLAGCAAPQVVRADLAGRRWYEVQSRYVTLFTDLDAADADALHRDIDGWRDTLSWLYRGFFVPDAVEPAGRLVVVYLDDCADLEPLWRERVAGMAALGNDFEGRRTVLTCGPRRGHRHAAARATIVHELAHTMNFHFFPSLPPWLEEGLATYFETLVPDDDGLLLGEYPVRKHDPGAVLPALRELTALSHERFHALGIAGYLAAWRLVRILAEAEYNPRLRRMLAAMADGAGADRAWASALGDLAPDRIEARYRDLDPTGTLLVWQVGVPPPVPPVTERRALDRGDIHDVWVRTILTFAEPARRRRYAEQQLALARRDAAAWTGADHWHAVLAFRDGRHAEAERLLRAHVARNPGDVRGLTGLLTVAIARLDRGGGPIPTAELAALRDEVAALQRRARTGAALNALAAYFAVLRRPEIGEGFARRAVAVEPGCSPCETTLAVVLYQRGRFDQAVDHLERAVRLRGDGDVPPAVAAQLDHYRRAARRQREDAVDAGAAGGGAR